MFALAVSPGSCGTEPTPAAADPPPPAALEATARFKPGGQIDGAWRRRLVDQRFVVAPLWDPAAAAAGPRREVLLRITREKRETLGLDDADVTLTTTAWIGREPIDLQGESASVAWQVTDHADHGDFWGEAYYRTRLEPVGPGNPTDRYYDRATGRLRFASTVEPLDLGRRGFRRARHLAYVEAAGFDAPACLGEHGLGLLSLVLEDGRRRDVLVSDPTARTTAWAPDWQVVDPASGLPLLRATPGRPIPEQLDLVLTYERSEPGAPGQPGQGLAVTLRLPLRDGEPDLAGAQVPPPYRIAAVECDLARPRRR